jgi:hypothetical protein
VLGVSFLETLLCLLTIDVLQKGIDLPELHELHVGKREAEPVRNERKVDYSSPLVGPASSAFSEILMSPASSNVKSGLVRRFEMNAIA